MTVPLLGKWYDTRIGVPRYLRSRPRTGNLGVKPESDARLDLVSVAFNNPEMVATQANLLASRLEDPYELCVVDNSSDAVATVEVASVAARSGSHYLRPPALPVSVRRDPSLSHGLTLNWAYRNWLAPRGASFVGTLDHDVFPLRRTSLIDELGGEVIWGLPQERLDDPSIWYPWPGLTVIDARQLDLRSVDLRPDSRRGYDTGGGLLERAVSISGRPIAAARPRVEHRYQRFDGSTDPQSSYVELIDDWVHVINGSNWAESPWTAGKVEFVKGLTGPPTN